jgi:hypothetical protein
LFLGHKTQQQVQTIQMSQVFLALLSSSEPSFEYSIAEEWLLI